ncbi:MAG TPA: hypothetical protein VKF14_02380 [Candidatus Dormibacteraeota bacterium]|nr:hypothetical protein [Candidatus Dormibacteraeota bacterium]
MTKYAPLTVTQVVSHMRSAPDEDTKLRWCLQFLDDFSAAENEVRATLVADDPGYCGDRRWDAYVAALTEHLVASYDLAAPSWLFTAGRFLERWWFPVDLPSVRVTALIQSPASFRRRGIFITEADLSRC